MNFYLDDRMKKLLIACGVILLLFILLFVFYRVIFPLNSSIDNKERELKTEKMKVQVLEEKLKKGQSVKNTNSANLEVQLPITPAVDQLIVAIKDAAEHSDVEIQSMDFNESDADQVMEDVQNNEDTVEDINKMQESIHTNPNGVKAVTISMQVITNNDKEMESFLKQIEGFKRITQIIQLEHSLTETSGKTVFQDNIEIMCYYSPSDE